MNTRGVKYTELGGMDTRWRPAEGSAERIENMRVDGQGSWRCSGGYRSIFDESGGEAPFETANVGEVISAHWFSQRNGSRPWLLFEYINSSGVSGVFVINHNANSFPTIQSPTTQPSTGPGMQYLDVGEWVWFFNGYDAPMRTDILATERVGFAKPPPAPSVFGPTQASAEDSGFNQPDYSWLLNPPFYPDSASFGYVWPGAWGTTSAPEASNNPGLRGLGERPGDNDGSTEATRESWKYGYALVWINDLLQKSPPSAITWISGINYGNADDAASSVTTNAGKRMALVTMSDAPDNVRGAILYRTQNVAGVSIQNLAQVAMYECQRFYSAKGVSWIDYRDDDELGELLDRDALGAMPAGFKYAALFKNTVFVAGMPEAADVTAFSHPGFPEQFPELNRITHGSRVIGYYQLANALVAFLENGIDLIKGDGAGGFYAQALTREVDCISTKAIVGIPGVGLLFLASDGPKLLVGALENTGTKTEIVNLAPPIQEVWDTEVNIAAIQRADAVLDRDQREVWIQVPAYGQDRPKLGLVYHYEVNRWSVRPNTYPISCFAKARDFTQHLFFGSWDSTQPGLFVYTPELPDIDGTAVSWLYRSAWNDLGDQWERKVLKYVEPVVHAYGTARQLTFDYQTDRRHLFDSEAQKSADMVNTEDVGAENRPEWGVATYVAAGTEGRENAWTKYDPAPMTFAVDGPRHQKGREFQWQLSGSGRVVLHAVRLGLLPQKDPSRQQVTTAPGGR